MPEPIEPIPADLPERETRVAVTEAVERAFQTPGPVENLIRVDAFLKASVENRVRKVLDASPPMDCRAGCGYCCANPVSVFPFELLPIINEIRVWSPLKLLKLRFRMARYRRARGRQRGQANHPSCPLLVKGSCSVYEVRPVACRRHHSTNVQACRDDAIALPPGADPFYAATSPIVGSVIDGLGDRGGFPGGLELAVALESAMNDPEIFEKFAGGADVFRAAHKRDRRR